MTLYAAVLHKQIVALLADIGANEVNHREAQDERHRRVLHLQRELNELTGASK